MFHFICESFLKLPTFWTANFHMPERIKQSQYYAKAPSIIARQKIIHSAFRDSLSGYTYIWWYNNKNVFVSDDTHKTDDRSSAIFALPSILSGLVFSYGLILKDFRTLTLSKGRDRLDPTYGRPFVRVQQHGRLNILDMIRALIKFCTHCAVVIRKIRIYYEVISFLLLLYLYMCVCVYFFSFRILYYTLRSFALSSSPWRADISSFLL